MASFLERTFKLSENKTDMKTEILAGITTFMTMAYILVVNPNILSATGMDKGALFTATALAAVIGTLIMALIANYPFALAPGMGLNAFFAFTVAAKYGWKMALTAVLVEGIIFIILTFVNVREAIFNSIPTNLKYAVSAGIGLFIALIGFQNAGIIKADPATYIALGDITHVTVVLAIIGVIITAILVVKQVKGAILVGIFATYVLGILAQLLGIYEVNPEIMQFNLIPTTLYSAPPSISSIAFKFDFAKVFTFEFLAVIFAFLFVDLFDTLGTLIGVSSKAGYLNEEGKLPRIKEALFADAIATTAGAMLGTSTTTTYVESAAGVADGGRTGLTSFTTAILFGLALLFSPIFLAVPSFATAPALIIVGFYMLDSVKHINFDDFSEGIPAFFTMIAMPFTYSISEGIVFGVVSYVLIKLFTGKSKDTHPLMYVLAVAFVLKYIFMG
ncbi:AGZA family xanthine/uracil permease-like MFS transporter [Orenia metallireducens]|uniref:Putative MFS transporter, AGZA family, xanthine/uracil permease n=1 Tax=Orenia metallireducens TaxID=1413210 RepID=A0A285GCB1_9FIRM|nr:NCS2 family permease [Orenia metallireducens]PRX32456.1 AGZA family xanthine/uracil permease-like MFS transporter [Orenia metallireducens]SNY21222.1 putative MFS transporter, AGZA family, xanthine/uracil permease [Orenia metallireducens]